MKKIIVYNNWGDTPESWIKRIKKQSPTDVCWENVELVSKIHDCDVVIICDGISSLSKEEFEIFKTKKKIFLQREPEQVQGTIKIDRSKVDKVVTYDENVPYVDWWLDADYNYLSKLKYNDINKKKTNPICIVSPKKFTAGQVKRLSFLQKIQNFTEIDFYGSNYLSNFFTNYCGPVEYEHTSRRDKSRIMEYNISISLENGKRKNFFTRLWEDLLCWTLPVYWGCPNLQDFLPEDSYRYVDIEKEHTQDEIKELFKPVTEQEIKAIEEARNLLLNKYNFFPYIKNILEDLK
jgi:hypothetical protein